MRGDGQALFPRGWRSGPLPQCGNGDLMQCPRTGQAGFCLFGLSLVFFAQALGAPRGI